MKKRLIFLISLLMLMSPYVYLAEIEVPMNLQVKFVLKILIKDRNLARYGDPVKIGVGSGKFLNALRSAMGKMKIKGKDFVAERINSVDEISNYKVVYIGKNWGGGYRAAAQKANANQCLMFCESEDGVLNGGGAISFKVVGSNAKILLHLENAKKQGANFPADFLKLTLIIGGI